MGLIDRDRHTCIGTVGQAHGIKGDVKVYPLTSTPDYYRTVRDIVLDDGKGLRAAKIAALRDTGSYWIVRIDGLMDRTAAEALTGAKMLVADEALRPLDAGEYFQHDLIGCHVETMDGRVLGEVVDVMETGANDVLDIKGSAGDVMVPLLASVVKNIDVEARRIRIDPLPGMLDEDE